MDLETSHLNSETPQDATKDYESPLYDELYVGWEKVTRKIANHASGGSRKTRETECLWIKPTSQRPPSAAKKLNGVSHLQLRSD
jgi:hypothetical protein